MLNTLLLFKLFLVSNVKAFQYNMIALKEHFTKLMKVKRNQKVQAEIKQKEKLYKTRVSTWRVPRHTWAQYL